MRLFLDGLIADAALRVDALARVVGPELRATNRTWVAYERLRIVDDADNVMLPKEPPKKFPMVLKNRS